MTNVRHVFLLAFACLACACDAVAEDSVAGFPAPLLQGREASVERRPSADEEPVPTVLHWEGSDESVLSELQSFLRGYCSAQVGYDSRIAPAPPGLVVGAYPDLPEDSLCGWRGAREQQVQLCMANLWQTVADTVMPVEFYASGPSGGASAIFRVAAVDAEPLPTSANNPINPIPMYRFAVPNTASERATFALAAVQQFGYAAGLGAYAIDPATCADGTLDGTVVADRDPSLGWVDSPERIFLSSLVAGATAEATHSLLEAADLAERYISAAADERRAHDRDSVRASNLSWRGRHDSRLEIAGMWMGTPVGSFSDEPTSDTTPLGTLPTCEAPAFSGAATEEEQVLIELGVDVRMPGPDLTDRFQEAMIADYPATFDDAAMLPPADFIAYIGFDQTALLAAAEQVRMRAEVTGRPIVDGPIQNGVARVLGTTETVEPTEGAYLYATTSGMLTGAIADAPAGRPSPGYGIIQQTGGRLDYASMGVLEVSDSVGAAIANATERTDFNFGDVRILQEVSTAIRERVPNRLQVCIMATGPTNPTQVMFRLFGNGLVPANYELWLGEEGLECALHGSLYGVPCNLDAVRINATPTIGSDATGSGFEQYLLWQLSAAAFPGSPGTIPLGEHIYISAWEGPDRNRRLVLGELSTDPGPVASGGGCYRHLVLPAGVTVMNTLERALAASPSDCTRPADSCAGVPYDVRLPLEDEISEAGEGRDDIESSFLHYLRLARQAADEADGLGEELVRAGLEADTRVEAAADQLQSLCGVPVSASAFPTDPPGAVCTHALDCCGAGEDCGFACVHGHCAPNDITAMIAEDDVGSEALRRCLGSSSEPLVPVALGSSTWYLYRGQDGDICSPAGLSVSAPPECPSRNREAIAIVETDPSGAFEVLQASPLNLVEPTTGSVGVPRCALFARIVAGMDPPPDFPGDRTEFIASVLEQDWISQGAFASLVAGLSFAGGPMETGAIVRGGRPWAVTSSVGNGPESAWPCRPLEDSSFDCGSVPAGSVAPLRCGGDCTTTSGRRELHHRLVRALEAAQAAVGGEQVLPTFPVASLSPTTPASALIVAASDLDWIEPDGSSPDSSYCTASGQPADCLRDARLLTVRPSGDTDGQPVYRCVAPLTFSFSPDADVWPTIDAETNYYEYFYSVCPALHRSSSRSWRVRWPQTSLDAVDFFGPARRFQNALTTIYAHPLAAPFVWLTPGAVPLADAPIEPIIIDDSGVDVAYDDVYLTGNQYWPIGYQSEPYTFSGTELELGAELVCLAAEAGPVGCAAAGDTLPPIRTIDDLTRLAAQIRCQADAIESSVDQLLLLDVPASVAADLRNGSVSGTFPATRGSYGESIASLRASVEDLPSAVRVIASTLRSFAGEIAVARSQLQIEDFQDQIGYWQMAGQIANEAARCVSSVGDKPWATASQCAAAAVGIAVSIATAVLQDSINDAERRVILAGVGVGFGEALDRLEGARAAVVQSYATINGILAHLDAQRSDARTLAARTLFLDRDSTGREYEATRSYHARLNTLNIRYRRAHERAIRMTYLARRAIEQRFGVDLSSMLDDMTLVPPPATWADGLCSMRGLDYSEIRGSGGDPGLDNYADRFVGDYVTLLEDFIESYRLDFPFQDGDSVALLSLRDDLRRVRELGPAESNNLFLGTESPATSTAWVGDCEDGERCVIGLDNPVSAFREERDGRPGDPGYSVFLRTTGEGASVTLASRCPEPDRDLMGHCPHTSSGVLGQEVSLGSGREYLVSWYEPRGATLATPTRVAAATDALCVTECTMDGASPATCADRCLNVDALQSACAAAATPGTTRLRLSFNPGESVDLPMAGVQWMTPSSDRWLDACNWQRFFVRFRAVEDGPVLIGFEPIAATPTDEPEVGWAMPQLEVVPLGADAVSVAPSPFMRTDEDRIIEGVAYRQDVDGSTFRSGSHWRRGCEYECPDGTGTTCAGADVADRSLLRCYWETDFNISVDATERGELLPTGGFATGNFNYRFRDFAINIVGVGVRDCSTASSPSSCYGSGYINYSLYHDGPFHVRNHIGELTEAPLFNGRVHQAQALAAERYLTNPLSGADRGLLVDYFRREFRGRPLDGHYRLRVYEADGFDWDRVEDIQVILNYRYWTRFE